jgi:hypothetical protein
MKRQKRFSPRLLLLLLVLGATGYFLFFGGYPAAPIDAGLPLHFEVNERISHKYLPLPTLLDVLADGKSYGSLHRDQITLTTGFDFSDQSGHKVASASKSAFSWGTEIRVKDSSGHVIGSLHKEVIASAFGFGVTNKYAVYNAADVKIAESEGLKAGVTDFTLKSINGGVLATIHRSFWWGWLHDVWYIDVNQPGVLDNRLLVMIPSFKTAADNDKS